MLDALFDTCWSWLAFSFSHADPCICIHLSWQSGHHYMNCTELEFDLNTSYIYFKKSLKALQPLVILEHVLTDVWIMCAVHLKCTGHLTVTREPEGVHWGEMGSNSGFLPLSSNEASPFLCTDRSVHTNSALQLPFAQLCCTGVLPVFLSLHVPSSNTSQTRTHTLADRLMS